MSTIYLLVDADNIIQAAYASVPQVPTGYTMDGVDSTAPNALAALTAPGGTYSYVNGTITRVPWFSVAYGSGTLTATLNGYTGASLPSVSFEVPGKTYSVQSVSATQTVNGVSQTVTTASLPLTIHPSLSTYQTQVSVYATGCVTAISDLGGAQTPTITVQSYQDSAGVVHVTPTSKEFLAGYWSGTESPAYVPADLATADSLLSDTVYNVLLPWALKQASPPVLTTAQQATVTDITDSVLPDLVTTLTTGMTDPHYAQYKADMAATKAALNGYQNDINTIPNLV